MPTLTALESVPPSVYGLVRDFRVRWALEEIGESYDELIQSNKALKSSAYKKFQPFNQVPALKEGNLVLFESGAIVMHLAESNEELMPKDEESRALIKTWMWAALNTVEPHLMFLFYFPKANEETPAIREMKKTIIDAQEERLEQLSDFIDGKDYLVGEFSAADLLMTHVLELAKHNNLLSKFPKLIAYHKRCSERPAFIKAREAQVKVFKAHAETHS